MKKILLGASIVFLLAAGCNKQVAPQNIPTSAVTQPSNEKLTITNPKGGEVWKIGTSQTIAWTSSKQSQETNKLVRISIIGERQKGCFKENGEMVCDKLNFYDLVKGIANTGSYTAMLGSEINPGKYVVSVWAYPGVGIVGGDIDETKTQIEIIN